VSATESRGFRAFLRLVSMLRPFRHLVVAAALTALLVVAARVLIPYYTGRAIDDIQTGNHESVTRSVILLVVAAFVMSTLNAVRRLLAGNISLGLEQLLRTQLYEHIAARSFRFFDSHATGQLLSRATVDVTQVRFFLGYGLTYFFMHAATLIAVPIICLTISVPLTIVLLVMMPTIYVISRQYSVRSHPVLKEVQQREADVTQAAEENIVGARIVRSFGQEANQVRHFATLTGHVLDAERRTTLLKMRYQPLYPFVISVTLAVVVLMSGRMVAAGTLTMGEFFSFYGYMLLITGPVRIIGNLLGRAQRATASGERLWEILDNTEQLPAATSVRSLPERSSQHVRGEVELRNVTFRYQDGRTVLDDVSVHIPAGTTVALLGPTGCGKSTLASLVPRLYDPDAGQVLMDGIDVRELDVHELRRNVGMVDQEPFLFSDTVRMNLCFGRPDATDDEINDALAAAQADGFVQRLPEGLDTVIGERGFTLSGGQRQRLAIARALLIDPRVLILDDATASVDSRVEARITQALSQAAGGRTTILIAHRPSTIALAQHIVILDHGRILAQGSHDALLESSELYRSIHEQRAARREFLLSASVDSRAVETDV
jgi:ABC-type multidrug transport system fused ATPase/permease subunit